MTEQNGRKKLAESLKAQIDEIDAKMDVIEGKSKQLQADARREYEERLVELQELRSKARSKLDQVLVAGDEQWEKLKDDTENAWKALRNSYNYFKSHFK